MSLNTINGRRAWSRILNEAQMQCLHTHLFVHESIFQIQEKASEEPDSPGPSTLGDSYLKVQKV